MDKLIFPNGGVELHADDFVYLQTAFQDALNGALSPFAETGKVVVLSGCAITFYQGQASVTPGYIYYKGEVFAVAAQTVSTQVGQSFTGKCYFGIAQTADPAGLEVLANGQQGDTYQRRRGIIIGGNSGNDLDSAAWLRFGGQLAKLLFGAQRLTNINNSSLVNGFTLGSSGNGVLRVFGNRASFSVDVVVPSMMPGESRALFVLPSWAVPPSPAPSFVVTGLDQSGWFVPAELSFSGSDVVLTSPGNLDYAKLHVSWVVAS